MTTSKRRPNGAGTAPRHRGDGRWEARVLMGYKSDGRPLNKSVYGATQRECTEAMNRLLPRSSSTLLPDIQKFTLREWLESFAKERALEVRESTQRTHQHYLALVLPILGGQLLNKVTVFQVETLYLRLHERGLSPSVRRHVHHFLGAAFKMAYRRDLLERNPMEKVQAPKSGRVRHPGAWSPKEVRRVLEVLKDSRWYALMYVSIMVGARPGEILALRWDNLRGDRLHITRTLLRDGRNPVFGEPKTAGSKRLVLLDPGTVAVLEEHRLRLRDERDLAGSSWVDFNLIFPSTHGTPIGLRNYRRKLKDVASQAGVSIRTPHELRHTNATLMLGKVEARLVSDRLGHTSTRMTDNYTHLREDMRRRGVVTLETLLEEDDEKSDH
jgi:integrase